MKYLNRAPYPVIFVIFFSVTLAIMVVVQSTLGTLRLFNQSEEKFESLTPRNTYSLSPDEQNMFYFSSTTNGQKEKNVLRYFSDNRDVIQNALKTMSAPKAEEAIKKIETIQQITLESRPEWQDAVPAENTFTPAESEIFTTPVDIQINPKNAAAPAGYTSMIHTVTEWPYFRDTLWNFPIIIDTKRVSPRGQVYNETVTLSATMTSLTEASKVLVHELGHMIDIYFLKSRSGHADPSSLFYDISWTEPTVMRSDMTSTSFISGYSATNQYEDFAESFAFYVFHNKDFQRRAQSEAALKEKYDFLQQYVFWDLFSGTSYEKSTIPKTFWDVTKIVLKTNQLSDIFAGIFQIFRSA